MVKAFFAILIFNSFVFAYDANIDKSIKALIDDDVYAKNRSFISIVFKNSQSFYKNGRVDVVKVANELKENGLLKIFFDAPHILHVKFNTSGSSLFFVKLMGDTLRSMGYYRFLTSSAKLDNSKFEWSISLKSEYAIDPTLLAKELEKRGAKIEDIKRINRYDWAYDIDVATAYLNVEKIEPNKKIMLSRALSARWLDISSVKKLIISSEVGNRWYPNISIYDRSLRVLKVYRHDKQTKNINIMFPRDAVYVKISDLYSIKNIKNGLYVIAQETR